MHVICMMQLLALLNALPLEVSPTQVTRHTPVGSPATHAHLLGRQLPLVHHGSAGQGAEVDVVLAEPCRRQVVLQQLAQHKQLPGGGGGRG